MRWLFFWRRKRDIDAVKRKTDRAERKAINDIEAKVLDLQPLFEQLKHKGDAT